MEYLLIAIAAFLVSGLTLFSGFGLGTLLLPVFTLFLPVEAAVAATAVVHGANNVLKTAVVGGKADRELVLKFGIPAVAAAFAGAAVLGLVSSLEPLATYELGGRRAVITPLKLLIGLLMLCFALFELLPRMRDLSFQRRHLFIGGLLSGFFGGLSGHQGALRSAFLVKAGISTEAFVGTNAIIGLTVDAARILVYAMLAAGGAFASLSGARERMLVLVGIGAAFLGVLAAKRYISKVTMANVQILTGVMLAGVAIALALGII
ncbi:MAG: sulfite exporter TauE/SafE family protein [Candidatus Abyssobacteria bacterium SURF_5]|uniref:Probable membrane transporter protein n=1 Tax=Abyssobacteria bacterium (strain SURF_5) TaxID=2093360 RepID=A0A3A4NCC8_ABYX5|nr:MAG: sulfite exporter TauE/SafE family protein [Candidatus Abyssubacteria bacterium SURF_5]